MIDLGELPPLLNPAEVAQLLRTSENSLAQDRYLGRGLPFIKHGRRVLYAKASVLEYLDANTCQRTDETARSVV